MNDSAHIEEIEQVGSSVAASSGGTIRELAGSALGQPVPCTDAEDQIVEDWSTIVQLKIAQHANRFHTDVAIGSSALDALKELVETDLVGALLSEDQQLGAVTAPPIPVKKAMPAGDIASEVQQLLTQNNELQLALNQLSLLWQQRGASRASFSPAARGEDQLMPSAFLQKHHISSPSQQESLKLVQERIVEMEASVLQTTLSLQSYVPELTFREMSDEIQRLAQSNGVLQLEVRKKSFEVEELRQEVDSLCAQHSRTVIRTSPCLLLQGGVPENPEEWRRWRSDLQDDQKASVRVLDALEAVKELNRKLEGELISIRHELIAMCSLCQ